MVTGGSAKWFISNTNSGGVSVVAINLSGWQLHRTLRMSQSLLKWLKATNTTTTTTVSTTNITSTGAPTTTSNDMITECLLYSMVVQLVKLILVMPATNAISERSFSALRHMKTWLRSTMQQSRLNWYMILHIHKELTDALDLNKVANEFASRNFSRQTMFGKFD